jgi:hypothetical protein
MDHLSIEQQLEYLKKENARLVEILREHQVLLEKLDEAATSQEIIDKYQRYWWFCFFS